MLTFPDIVPLYCDVLVPICTGVFVVQAQSVHELMAKVPHSTDL